MEVFASDIYRLSVDELRQVCFEHGLDNGGNIRALRFSLSQYLKVSRMQSLNYEDPTPEGNLAGVDGREDSDTSPPVGWLYWVVTPGIKWQSW
jgi:hypothetical protein